MLGVLPIDVYHEIVAHLDAHDLSLLARTCSILNDVVAQPLYRVIAFTPSTPRTAIVALFHTLSARQSRAVLVRSLQLDWSGRVDRNTPLASYLSDVLLRLTHLERLAVSPVLQLAEWASPRLLIPSLRELAVCRVDGRALARFLGRHPGLTSLALCSGAKYILDDGFMHPSFRCANTHGTCKCSALSTLRAPSAVLALQLLQCVSPSALTRLDIGETSDVMALALFNVLARDFRQLTRVNLYTVRALTGLAQDANPSPSNVRTKSLEESQLLRTLPSVLRAGICCCDLLAARAGALSWLLARVLRIFPALNTLDVLCDAHSPGEHAHPLPETVAALRGALVRTDVRLVVYGPRTAYTHAPDTPKFVRAQSPPEGWDYPVVVWPSAHPAWEELHG